MNSTAHHPLNSPSAIAGEIELVSNEQASHRTRLITQTIIRSSLAAGLLAWSIYASDWRATLAVVALVATLALLQAVAMTQHAQDSLGREVRLSELRTRFSIAMGRKPNKELGDTKRSP